MKHYQNSAQEDQTHLTVCTLNEKIGAIGNDTIRNGPLELKIPLGKITGHVSIPFLNLKMDHS